MRFGSKEEKELKDMLIAIFDLTKVPEVGALTSIKMFDGELFTIVKM